MDGTLQTDRLRGAMFAMGGAMPAGSPIGSAAGPRAERATAPGMEGAAPLIGVIRNPRSHRNLGHVPEMADRPNIITRTPVTKPELVEALEEFAKAGIDYLVVDGGDGTVRDVLSYGYPIYGDAWPRMIFLPKGKTNALAADLGTPNRWSLTEALDAVRDGQLAKRRPIMVDRLDAEGKTKLGFILGAGIFTKAVVVGQAAHRFGAFNSFAVAIITAVSVLQALLGIGPSNWRKVTAMRYFPGSADDASEAPHGRHGEPGHRYAILLSTLTRFPLGMKPFARFEGGINYALLDAPIRRAVAMVPALLMGWDRPLMLKLGVHRGTSADSILELGDRFILDGEAFPPGRYRLGLGPQLQFVVP